jgi:TetR/AcrR family transcriptional regulator, regulator of cefoperazone and chloramphenicol sensitivity
MRSVKMEDTTAAARIRDAAIARFGADGYDATTVRDIAQDAGVSAALVIHHFGSKDGLRQACDEWLIAELIEEKGMTSGPAIAETMQAWLDDSGRFHHFIDYFATMLAAGGEGGNRLFDRLLHETAAMLEHGVEAGAMHPSSDPEIRALMITINGLAPLLLREQLTRVLGTPFGSAAAARRMTLPTLELYTDGLYTDSTVLDAARAALEGTVATGEGIRSDKGPGNPNQDPDPPDASSDISP